MEVLFAQRLRLRTRRLVPHGAKVNVYDWVCLPLSLANGLCTNGMLDLGRFPCHQLNGSFNALSALRKTVHWANQEVFEPNDNEEPIAFVVFRRTKAAAMRMDCWRIWRQCHNENF